MDNPDVLTILGRGIVLGLVLAVPLGPINVEIIRRGLTIRPSAGLAVGLGACTTDGIYALVAGVGLGFLLQLQGVVLLCYAVGAVLLTWMGVGAIRDGLRRWREAKLQVGNGDAPSTPLWRGFLFGMAITAASPMNIVFWLSVPTRFFGGKLPGLAVILLTSMAVLAGTAMWVLTLTALMTAGRKYLRARPLAGISIAGGVAILGFAAWLAWSLVSALTER